MKFDSNIENLMKLGLRESEAKVYTNLLKKKNFTATEIAKVSGVSRAKIYEFLHKLVERGLCVEIIGGVKRYYAANPEKALNGLIQGLEIHYKKDIEEKKTILTDLLDNLIPLYDYEKENTTPLEYIRIVKHNRIQDAVIDLETHAKKEILAFIMGPYIMSFPKVSKKVANYIELMSNKDIIQKSIFIYSEAKENATLKQIEKFVLSGEQIRIINDLPFKMSIYDEKTVVCTFESKIVQQENLTALIIEHSAMAKTLKNTFNMYWDKAMTVEEFKEKEKLL